jgi:glycosyltransferase involved in cell wall biosynthesis
MEKLRLRSYVRYKVLFVASWYPGRKNPISGIFTKRQAEAVSRFCDVAVLVIDKDPNMKKNVEVETEYEDGILTVRVYYKESRIGISLIRKGVHFLRLLLGSYLGLKIIKEKFHRPDIIHLNDVIFPNGLIVLILKLLKGIPYVVTQHDDTPVRIIRGLEEERRFWKLKEKLIFKKSNAVIVDSRAMKDAIVKLGLCSNPLVIPNVISPETFSSEIPQKKDVEKKKIILVSRLDDRQKNISGIIKSLFRIYNDFGRKDFEFHIIGDGDDRVYLECLSRELNLLGRCVFFHGYLPEKEKLKLLSESHFHVLNSNFEGFSVATAEAIACGLPVISTRCGGPEDFVNENVGILIEPNNQEELESAILYMLDNWHRYDSEKLREYAEERFSYDAVGERIYEVYRNIPVRWEVGYAGEKIFISPDWLVLDVGSGDNPFRRADVLLDREIGESIHRAGKELKIEKGKNLIVGDALSMPFKDRAFDFVIASHIAEHIDDPSKFCEELHRIAKKGYIETPGPFSDFLLNESYHKWRVFKRGKEIVFLEKTNFKSPSETFYRIFYLNQTHPFHKPLYTSNKFLKFLNYFLNRIWKYLPYTYTKYYWDGKIRYRVIRKCSRK